MNSQLVESIVQLIKSLSPEEQALIEAKLYSETDWEREYHKLVQLKLDVASRRGNKPFDPSIDNYLHLTRDERNTQQDELISDSFGDVNK